MTSLDRTLADLDPITLERANDLAELQTRVDRKYLLDEATLVCLLDALAAEARVLEIDGRRTCRYRSTYFDTPSLSLYRAAVQGRRRRHKVRTRAYGETGPAFLEVKSKGRRGGNEKARIGYERQDADAITPAGHTFIESETGWTGLASLLQPVLTTSYERSTVIDRPTGTRLTVDRHLQCSEASGMAARFGAIVVETKSSRAPGPADRWLWRHHHRPVAISKFCTGLATIHPDLPANKWRTIIDRHWHVMARPPAVAGAHL